MGQVSLRVDELIMARELRDGRPLPPDEVARASGVPESTLTAMLSNQVDQVALSDLARLCDYFHCTPGELLHLDQEPDTIEEDEVESRDIVEHWERTYGADERVPDA